MKTGNQFLLHFLDSQRVRQTFLNKIYALHHFIMNKDNRIMTKNVSMATMMLVRSDKSTLSTKIKHTLALE